MFLSIKFNVAQNSWFCCHLNLLWCWHGFPLRHHGILRVTSEVWFMELTKEFRIWYNHYHTLIIRRFDVKLKSFGWLLLPTLISYTTTVSERKKKKENSLFYPFPIQKHKGPNLIWPYRKIGQGQSRVIIWINLVVLEYPMLHTSFQGHRSIGSG